MHNEPGVIAAADKIVMPMEFITGRLSGNYITDHTMASGTMLYNIHTRCWDTDILNAFGIDIDKLPLIKEAGTPVGIILPDIADELGLPKETLVVVGGQDQKCASLAGGIDPSTLTVSLGTAAAAEVICSSPVLDPAFSIPSFSYLFEGCWVLEGAVATSGAAVKWFKNNWASSYTYAEMDELAMQSYASQNNVFFYPYLSSDLNDDKKGVFYGLGLDTGVSDMAMAVLEGITFEIFEISKRLLDLSDTKKINKIRVFGGGANSGIWCQLLCDVCDLPVDVMHTPETAAQGAAILAGVGAGKYKDAFSVASQLKVFHTFLPDVCNSAIYTKKKADYLTLKKKLFK
jgi:xylulokinase